VIQGPFNNLVLMGVDLVCMYMIELQMSHVCTILIDNDIDIYLYKYIYIHLFMWQ